MKCKFLFFSVGFAFTTQFVFAEGIATDGTMGAVQTLTGANVTIPQTLGTTVGNNLFHSFADFNINTGQTATFTGSDNLQNVISRVTGGNASNIDGVLKSDIKNADFYFINPNGITFGANASVDVPAAFHVSTADKIEFDKNGGVFYADLNKDSKLSSDAPAGFGFLGTSKANNGLIDFDGSKLTFKNGQTLDVVAEQITIQNKSYITSPAGEIRLVAMQGEGVVNLEKTDDTLQLPITIPTTSNAGKISVKDSAVDTSGNGGGRIAIWGGETSFENNSEVKSDNNGETNSAPTKGLYVNVNSLNIDHSLVASDALAAGKAGNVAVKTADFLNIFGNAKISSSTKNKGSAGNVDVIVGNDLIIDAQGNMANGILSETAFGSSGNAGTMSITSGRDMSIINGGEISSASFGIGTAGSLVVTSSGKLFMDSKGFSEWFTGIISGTIGKGNAGAVSVTSKSDMSIVNGAVIGNSTYGSGNADIVSVKSGGNLLIDNQDNQGQRSRTGIFSTSQTGGGGGDAGAVLVTSDGDMNIVHGGEISSATMTAGKGGNITVISNGKLTIDPQDFLIYNPDNDWFTGIISGTEGKGAGGEISVLSKGDMFIGGGGSITSGTIGIGNAGMVTVLNNGNLIIDDQKNQSQWGRTGIFSTAEPTSSGDAGVVSVISKGNITILGDGGDISSSTLYNTGNSDSKAGSVTVNADTLYINAGSISSEVLDIKSGGKAGDVAVKTNNWLHLANGGNISVENNAIVQADSILTNLGKIAVTAPSINMTTNSHITSNSTGNVAAGNIAVNFTNRLNMNSSFITTEANTGDGGAIKINGDDLIYLKDSGFKTTVSGENGNGGDISVKAEMLVMDTGLIQANAKSGNGGNIDLALQALIPRADTLIKGGKTVEWNSSPSTINVIQAASQTGVSGTVTNSAPQLNLSGVLANVGNSNFENDLISQDYCSVGQGSSLARKGKGGLPLRAKDLQVH